MGANVSSIDCTKYQGWQEFTNENFFVQPIAVNLYARFSGSGLYTPSVNFSLSYNQISGILSIGGTSVGTNISNPDLGAGFTYRVYLITY